MTRNTVITARTKKGVTVVIEANVKGSADDIASVDSGLVKAVKEYLKPLDPGVQTNGQTIAGEGETAQAFEDKLRK